MIVSLITGIVYGAIHVLSGFDHLIPLVPTAFSHPKLAIRTGLAWGIGHSTGVIILSSIAVIAKDKIQVDQMSSLAEFSVGFALLAAGVFAIRRSLGLSIHTHKHEHGSGKHHDHIHLHFGKKNKHSPHTHASTGLGILHGLAGPSHLLAVAPALALSSIGAVVYMIAYLIGSIITMIAFLATLSYAAKYLDNRAIPGMIGAAGGLSIATGIYWLQNIPVAIQ